MPDGTVVAPTRMRGYAVAFGLIALTAALAALHLFALGGQPAFRLDDAFIVLNNASALLESDQAFPDAPPLLGSTSLSHTFLVAGLSFVMPPETALLFLGWAGLLLFSLGVARFAGLEGAPDWLQLLFGLVALLCGDLFRVHLNGLETSLVLAASIWTVIGTTERWPPVPFGAFLGVLPFLRPELAVLGAMCCGGSPKPWWNSMDSTMTAVCWMRAAMGCCWTLSADITRSWRQSGKRGKGSDPPNRRRRLWQRRWRLRAPKRTRCATIWRNSKTWSRSSARKPNWMQPGVGCRQRTGCAKTF